METKEWNDISVKHDQVDNCVPKSFFPSGLDYLHEYNRPADAHTTDCSDDYCKCPATIVTSFASITFSALAFVLTLLQFW